MFFVAKTLLHTIADEIKIIPLISAKVFFDLILISQKILVNLVEE